MLYSFHKNSPLWYYLQNEFEPNVDYILMPNGKQKKNFSSKNEIITNIDGRIVTFVNIYY